MNIENSSILRYARSERGSQEGSRYCCSTYVAGGVSGLCQWVIDAAWANERMLADLQSSRFQYNSGNSIRVSQPTLSKILQNSFAVSEREHRKNNVIFRDWGWINHINDRSTSQSDLSYMCHLVNANIFEDYKAADQQSEVKRVQQVVEPHSKSKTKQIVEEKQPVIQRPENKSIFQSSQPFKVEGISTISINFSKLSQEEQQINIVGHIGEKKTMERDCQPQPEGKEEKQQLEEAEGKEEKQKLKEEEGEKEKQQEEKPASSKEKRFQRYWGIIRQKLTEDNTITKEKVSRYKQLLKQAQDNPQIDRALGAIYGALIGDALGAYCSSQYQLSDQTVDEAMQMNGGGIFGLAAGQFTDDSELATHLLKGLSFFQQSIQLEEQESRLVCRVGLQYVRWFKSGPFDYGDTIRLGIEAMCKYKEQLREHAQGKTQSKFLEKMLGEISNRNKNSMGNGSLMRISPFAFFFSLSGIHPHFHAQFIRDEIRLTHPNETLAAAGVFWVNLLTTLIKRADDSKKTFCTIFNSTMTDHLTFQKQLQPWFDEAMKPKQQAMSGTTSMGFAKVAFSYGLRILYYLAQGQETKVDAGLYLKWLRWIIKRAGATDTNGAIGGGLMGSIVGFWGLPEQYVVRTLKTVTDHRLFKIIDEEKQPQPPSKPKYPTSRRASFYEPCNVLLAALDLLPKLQLYREKFSQYK